MALTYPVDTENTRYTFITGGVTTRRQRWPNATGEPIAGASPDLVVLEEKLAEIPVYDPATQKLGPQYWDDDIPDETAWARQDVLAMTQEEQDAYAEYQLRQDYLGEYHTEEYVLNQVLTALTSGTNWDDISPTNRNKTIRALAHRALGEEAPPGNEVINPVPAPAPWYEPLPLDPYEPPQTPCPHCGHYHCPPTHGHPDA